MTSTSDFQFVSEINISDLKLSKFDITDKKHFSSYDIKLCKDKPFVKDIIIKIPDLESLSEDELINKKDELYFHYLTLKNKIEMAKPIESLSMIPVMDFEVYQMYQSHEKMHWNEFTKDFIRDRPSYDSLNDHERSVVDRIFAYFLVTDGAISGNIQERFMEACRNYQQKSMIVSQDHRELTHANTYGISISVLKRGKMQGILDLVNDMKNSEPIMKKINFLREVCFKPSTPIWELWFYAACTEGIHFSALFCIIFYFRKCNLLPEFCVANEEISRDESLHRDYNILQCMRAMRDFINSHPEEQRKQIEKDVKKRCYEIVNQAYDIEMSFINLILDIPFRTLTKEKLINFTQLTTDNLLYHCQLEKIFFVKNECEFLDEICVDQKSNFYDMMPTAYRNGSLQINNWEKYISQEYEENSYNITLDDMNDI